MASFFGWFEVEKGGWLEQRRVLVMFFFVQVLGSAGLGEYMYLGEGTVGYLCLVGGLGLKIGARGFHS